MAKKVLPFPEPKALRRKRGEQLISQILGAAGDAETAVASDALETVMRVRREVEDFLAKNYVECSKCGKRITSAPMFYTMVAVKQAGKMMGICVKCAED